MADGIDFKTPDLVGEQDAEMVRRAQRSVVHHARDREELRVFLSMLFGDQVLAD